MPIYKAWDVKQETRKAVAAGSFEEFAKVGELFLISEIQFDKYSECRVSSKRVRYDDI